MTYNIANISKKIVKKASKSLMLCCTLSFLFYSTNSLAAASSLPDCSTITSPTEPDVGNNCSYLGLQICTTTDTSTETPAAAPNNVPRVDCANLIDMPLCSDITVDSNGPIERKNCVKECAELDIGQVDGPGNYRGVDFAVHNKHCVRFCGSTLSDGSTTTEVLTSAAYAALAPEKKCVARKCHQDVNGNTGSNCTLTTCNLLTVDELDDAKFKNDDTKQYCDGSRKCYDFPENKLQYLISRQNNTMCLMHECQPEPYPASSLCDDDTNNVTNKTNSYVQSYLTNIVGIGSESPPLTPASLNPSNDNADVRTQLASSCTPRFSICKPVFYRDYYCDSAPTLNPNCDSTSTCAVNCSPGLTCTDTKGFCQKTIDCNDPSNASERECIAPGSGEEGSSETDTEPHDSWFYNPKPMDKSRNGSSYKDMDTADLCYKRADLKSNGWGKNAKLGIIPLGYFHSQYSPDKTRSPGMCKNMNGVITSRDGLRGTGYLYLCGNEGNINAKVSSHTAYHSGPATTTFTNTDSETRVRVCVRFKNSTRPSDFVSDSETCGRRECAISCAFNICRSQLCGFDVCRTLTVKSSESDKCMMDGDLFNNRSDFYCSSIIDSYLRIRAVQYGNKVCTFLDSKGQFAYNPMFMRGTEKLSDGTCLGDTASDCNGKNSNDMKGLADKWRAVMRIPYIEDNRGTAQNRGYIKINGLLVREQDCVKVPLRVRSPKLYNLATQENSFRLFRPPLFILNTYDVKGGTVSNPASDELGTTNFSYPQIEVEYGKNNDTVILSLDLDKTGYEPDPADRDGNATSNITTIFNGISYTTTVSIKKEFSQNTNQPSLCLYETIQDTAGNYRDYLIDCVDREYPEISSATQSIKITDATPANEYDGKTINLEYEGTNGSSTHSTLIPIEFINTDINTPVCRYNTENYRLCAQRDPCNMLNNECIQADIDINNAAPDVDISSFEAIRNYCNVSLKPACDAKKDDLSGGITDKAYGWHNEICITSGFETKLKDVLAHNINGGAIKGKCIIDTGASTGACTGGGKPAQDGAPSTADNCICTEASSTSDPNLTIRKQTPREAGLCIDIPEPSTCPDITYTSDAARTAGINSGHAEFTGTNYPGMDKIEGTCLGNWTYQKVLGVEVKPTLNCIDDGSGNAVWHYGSLLNPCVRYSCSAINTDSRLTVLNADSGTISYTNSYTTSSETTDTNQGQSNGFATWNAIVSDDTGPIQTATSCIPGFEEHSSNGMPTRQCSNQGIWQNVSGACVRKTCDSVNFVSNAAQGTTTWLNAWATSLYNPGTTIPSDPTDPTTPWYQRWKGWDDAGGASFNSVPASRIAMSNSGNRVAAESISTGTCNESLGYFQGGADAPTMKCDSDGVFKDLKNGCVTKCLEIDANSPANSNNGNAYWHEASVPYNDTDGEVDGSFNGCASGYVPYAYSPPKDKYGVEQNYTIDPDDSTKKVYVDGAASNPQRICKNSNVIGYNGLVAAYWQSTYPACTNYCPGATTDPRVGVGITKHQLSDGSYVYIEWPDTTIDHGQTTKAVIKYNDTTVQDVSHYYQGSTTKMFAVKRVCEFANNEYKWQTYDVGGKTEYVKPQCSSKQEKITNPVTNANFGYTTLPLTVDEGTTLNGTCVTNYGNASPVVTCQAHSNGHRYIDQFHYALTSGSACIRGCATPATNTTFGSFNESVYTGTAGIQKYLGDTIELDCSTGFGTVVGLAPVATTTQCGRSDVDDRSTTKPTVTCLSTGNWGSLTNNCTACRGCNQASSLTGDVRTDPNRSCNDNYNGTAQQIMAECNNANDGEHPTAFTTSHGSSKKIAHERERRCNCDNDNRDVCAVINMKCLDGDYQLQKTRISGVDIWWYKVNGSNCGTGVTKCGRDSQSRGNCNR